MLKLHWEHRLFINDSIVNDRWLTTLLSLLQH